MTEVYSSLTLHNLRKIQVGGSGFLDSALRNLVEAAHVRPMARARFAMYRWKTLESNTTTKKLQQAIHATLGYMMRNAEAEVIMSRFRTHENTFDYSAFLVAFLDAYDASTSTATTTNTTPVGSPPLSPRVEGRCSLRKAARRVSHVVGASQHFNHAGSGAALRRAKQTLEDAIRIRIIKQHPDIVQNIGNLSRQSFQSNMRSLYNVNFTNKEANALFTYLDTNKDNVISSAELTEHVQALVTHIRSQLLAENVVKRRIKRQASIGMSYDPQEFKRAVVSLTQALQTGRNLELSDCYLSQQHARKQIYEQLGVQLTRLQMQCLCYKIQNSVQDELSSCSSCESDATSLESVTTSTKSIASVSSQDNMRELPIHGAVLMKFYYQLQRYFGGSV